MRIPKNNTLPEITRSVRASKNRLRMVSDAKLSLIVGLVIRLMTDQLMMNRDKLISGVTDQLKLRGMGVIELFIIKWVISLAVDQLISWMESYASTYTKLRSMHLGPEFPELL